MRRFKQGINVSLATLILLLIYTPVSASTNPLLDLWTDEKNSKSYNPKDTSYLYRKPNKGAFFKNLYAGYNFYYPYTWNIDTHQLPNYVRLYHYNFRIDVTVHNTVKTYISGNTYISTTLSSVKDLITNDKKWSNKNGNFRLVEYKRPLIKELKSDMNQYAYLFIDKGKYIYTFQLKTSALYYNQKIKDLMYIANTFQSTTPKTFDLEKNIKQSSSEINYSHRTASLYIPYRSFMMGFYTDKTRDIELLANKFKTNIGSQFFYKPIDSNYDSYLKELTNKKRLPVVTFLLEQKNSSQNSESVKDIISGKFDSNINNWAMEIKKLDSPVLIRFGNEMNGSWTYWSYKNNYNDPDLYKLAYRHFVDVFKNTKVSNAYFVWNPNSSSSPTYNWNHATLYYPGDMYVDWVGMTSYNFGKSAKTKFVGFKQLYDKLYYDYTRSFANKPLMIGEFGSVEQGGSKAGFINEFFSLIPSKYPNIKIALWFSAKHDTYDFRVGTSQASTNAFITNMKRDNVIKSLN